MTQRAVFIPSTMKRYTIRPGAVSSVDLVEDLAADLAPLSAEFELGTSIAGSSGYSQQLLRLRGGNREWIFGVVSMWRVLLWDGTNDPRVTPITAGSFPAPTVIQTATTFSIIWTSVTYGDVVVTGTMNATTGEITAGIAVTLAAGILATYSLWAVDFPYLRVENYRNQNRAMMNVITSSYSGRVYHNASNPLSNSIYPYGLRSAAPSDVPEPLAWDANVVEPSAMRWIALYDREVMAGLMIRSKETYKETEFFFHGKDTLGTDVYVRHYPSNNLGVGVMGTLTTANVTIRSYAGGAHEACTIYRETLQSESSTWLSRGKVWGAATTAIAGVPSVARTIRCFVWFSIPAAAATNPTRAEVVTYIYQQTTRAATKYGAAYVCLLLYNVGPHDGIADRPPDVSTMPADTVALIAAVKALGVLVVAYQIPLALGTTSTWWGVNSGTAAGLVCLDRAQAQRTMVGGTVGGSGLQLCAVGNPDSATMRGMVVTEQQKLFTTCGTNIAGLYLDSMGGSLFSDYRTSLTASKKGPGAATWTPGLRSLFGEMLTAHIAVQSACFLMTEFGDEAFLDSISYFCSPCVDFLLLQTSYPTFRTALGEYALHMTFQGLTPPAIATPTILLALNLDILCYQVARAASCGVVMSLASHFPANSAIFPLFVAEGEPNYTAWATYIKPALDLIGTIEAMKSNTIGNLAAYFRGRLLAPMDDSHTAHAETKPFIVSYLEFVATLSVAGPRVDASVWVQDEELGQPVGILIVNFRSTSETCRIKLDPARYLPYLSGRRYLVLNTAGVRTLVATCDWGVDTTVTVAARSAVLYEMVVMAPP